MRISLGLVIFSVLALASSAPNAYHHRRQHDHHRRQNVGLDTDPTNMQPTPTCYIAHEKRCIEPGNRAMDRFSCNQCDCLENGQMVCTEMACQRPVCDYAGRLWAVNQTFNDPLSDNRCVCTENKVVMCTMMYSPKRHCKYEGQIYYPGDSFVAKDCCNHCTCSDRGHVMCTMRACSVRLSRVFAKPYQSQQDDY